MTTAVSFERRGHRVVDAYYARRIPEEMAALGYFITGTEPERRKQQPGRRHYRGLTQPARQNARFRRSGQ